MSLRIPLTKDQTLQVEFHEVERRLRRLEKGVGITPGGTVVRVAGSSGSTGTSSTNLSGIIERLEILEAAVAALPTIADIPDYGLVGQTATRGLVPNPGTAVPPTGTDQQVLTEDNYWGYPLRGLIGVATSGEQTDLPYDTVDLKASLRAGDLSVSDVNCFNLYTHGGVEYEDTFFDDLRVEPVARTTGANAPTFEKWFDDTPGSSRGVYLYSFDDAAAGSEKEIFFTMQLPHGWAEGTPIRLHAHWVGAVSDTTADPRWGLEYCFKDAGAVFGDTVIVYSAGTHFPGDIEGTPDPDVTAGTHYITPLVTITPDTSNDKISAVLIGRLFRDSANGADTYNAGGAKVGLLYIDAHVELSSPGSRLQYIK